MSEQSGSQPSFPSRLIVHMPAAQLRLIMRGSHAPSRHMLMPDRARPCGMRSAARSISSSFSLRIIATPVKSLLLPADCGRLFVLLSEII